MRQSAKGLSRGAITPIVMILPNSDMVLVWLTIQLISEPRGVRSLSLRLDIKHYDLVLGILYALRRWDLASGPNHGPSSVPSKASQSVVFRYQKMFWPIAILVRSGLTCCIRAIIT